MGSYTRFGQSVVALALIGAGCADPQSDLSRPDGETLEIDAPDAGRDLPAPHPQDDVVPPPSDATADAAADTSDAYDILEGPGDTDASPAGGLTPRECEHTFTYTPDASVSSVQVATSFLGWGDGAMALSAQSDGSYAVTIALAGFEPGSYGYKLIVDGEWLLDPANKMRRFDDGTVNSKLLVPDCRAPELVVTTREIHQGTSSATLEIAIRPGVDTPLDPASVVVTHNFGAVAGAWDAERGTVLLDLSDLSAGKHTVRVDASGAGPSAIPARPAVVSFWFEATPFEWRDAALYFAFTDRFADGDPAHAPDPCLAADSIANWHGGDWPGITAAIEAGYFEDLGVNALWLSAPMDNPEGCEGGTHGHQYTSFHAYFPVDLVGTEARFGSLEDLRGLVTAAHARGIRVIVDLPANHVHDTAPEWADHSDTWFNIDGLCRDQGWEPVETCWFEPYLPDLNHRVDEVVEHLTEVALKWAIDADLDGFRVDAVKHVHPHFLNTLRAKLDARMEAHGDQVFWTVGETFTGGWQPGGGSEAELVAAYVADDQLYGQFDFPLFWAIRGAFAHRTTPLSWLAEVASGSATYYGEGAIMASFLGNHDVTRFISEANGDDLTSCPGGGETVAWDCPPTQPLEAEAYTRLVQAFTFLTVYPAVPLVYYGDEIGLAGAGDPDNRRPMPWSDLSALQETTKASVSTLLGARRSNEALRRGDFTVLHATDATLIVERKTPTSRAYGVFNLGDGDLEVSIPVAGEVTVTEALGGSVIVSANGSLDWSAPALSAQLWTTSL